MLVVIREAKKLFSVICDNSQSQRNFCVKIARRRPTKSTKQRETLQLSSTRPTFFKSCVTSDEGHDTYKKVLWSKENIGIDACYEIRKKFTMLKFSKPHDLFHFHVNYREA